MSAPQNASSLLTLIVTAIAARLNCLAATPINTEWKIRHEDNARKLAQWLPAGSGFDNGTTIDLDRSTSDRLVFHTAFHHMSEHGMYNGWTEHTVTIRPSLLHAFTVNVSGRNRNDIKPFIAESVAMSLQALFTEAYIDGDTQYTHVAVTR